MAEFCHWHFGRPFLALRHNLESLPIYHLTLRSSIREPVVAGSAVMRWKTEILHSSNVGRHGPPSLSNRQLWSQDPGFSYSYTTVMVKSSSELFSFAATTRRCQPGANQSYRLRSFVPSSLPITRQPSLHLRI